MDIVVTGGTGLLGRHIVNQLVAERHSVRVLTRSATRTCSGARAVNGDLRTGEGLSAAVDGADAVVHTASDPRDFTAVDIEGTRRLLEESTRQSVPHLVYISIVGVDRIPWPYYRAKAHIEEMIAASGTPSTTLRATQFHEFTLDLIQRMARLPVITVPRGWQIQPVDVREVARGLADAATTAPAGRLPDLAGPEVLTLTDTARSYARAFGMHRPVWSVPVPGAFSRAWRAGAAVAPDNRAGGQTWNDFLAGQASRRGTATTSVNAD